MRGAANTSGVSGPVPAMMRPYKRRKTWLAVLRGQEIQNDRLVNAIVPTVSTKKKKRLRDSVIPKRPILKRMLVICRQTQHIVNAWSRWEFPSLSTNKSQNPPDLYEDAGAQDLEAIGIEHKRVSASFVAVQNFQYTFLSGNIAGVSSVDYMELSPMDVESQCPLHNQAVGDERGNSLRPSGQTKRFHPSARLPDEPVQAENEPGVGKYFEETCQNGIHRPFETEDKSSGKLHLMQRPI